MLLTVTIIVTPANNGAPVVEQPKESRVRRASMHEKTEVGHSRLKSSSDARSLNLQKVASSYAPG